MNPEDRLRELQDPDRWMDVRLPKSPPATTARRTAPASARTVLAFAIAAVAIAALWVGLTGLRPAGQPAGSSGPAAATTQPAAPSPSVTASASPSPTVAPAVACSPGSLTVRFIDSAGGAAGNWARAFTIKNAGGTCSIPTTAIVVGDRAARSGNTSPTVVLTGRSTTTLYLMAATTCDGTTPNLDRNVTATVRLELDHVTTVIGSFPALRCANPFLDR